MCLYPCSQLLVALALVVVPTQLMAANVAPVADDITMSLPYMVQGTIQLAYRDADKGQSLSASVVSPPAHGTITSFQSSSKVCYYQPALGYSGPDSFTYRVYDGTDYSNTATVTLTVLPNAAPTGVNTKYICTAGSQAAPPKVAIWVDDPNTRKSVYTIYDPGQIHSMVVVNPPAHGAVTTYTEPNENNSFQLFGPLPAFSYVPVEGFTGKDSFTFRVNDGMVDSVDTYTAEILVCPMGKMSGATRLIIVNPELDGLIDDELDAVINDIETSGATVKKVVRSFASEDALRTFLGAEYHTADQFIDGVMLIGSFPKTADDYDLTYWNIDHKGTGYVNGVWMGVIRRHFWLSRVHLPTTYGTQAALAKRYLRMNHGVRSGQIRMPHQALLRYRYDNSGLDSFAAAIESTALVYDTLEPAVSPEKDGGPTPAEAMDRGAVFFWEKSHGNTNSYDGGSFGTSSVMDRSTQYLLGLYNSCSSGALSAVVNHHILTRGGACMFAVGAPRTSGGESFRIDDYCGIPGFGYQEQVRICENFRQRLRDGDTWGRAWVDFYTMGNDMVIYGDLDISAFPSPANAVPSISRVTASSTSGMVPLSVTLQTEATDSDDGIASYEYFFDGFDYGRRDPVVQIGASGHIEHTYTLPRRYKTRVTVVDHYGMRAFQELDIAVAPDSRQPLRIACGANADYTDGNGRLWLADQQFLQGTWGWSSSANRSPNSTSAVSATNDDALYQTARETDQATKPVDYRVPLANGSYTSTAFCGYVVDRSQSAQHGYCH